MRRLVLATVVAFSLTTAGVAFAGEPPEQRLPSALLQYPFIVVEGGGAIRDTRVELVNLTGRPLQLQCFYVYSPLCRETDFFVSLTANQPLSWLASRGTSNMLTGTAVPPFFGTGELKSAVLPSRPEIEAHNAIQGRALVFGADGQTLAYGAVGFRRLSAGDFTSVLPLDGETYAQCPEELHFAFLASDEGSDSEIVLVPCSQDLANLRPTTTTVQFRIVNEFEETLSAALTFNCFDQRSLQQVSRVFTRDTLGTLTGHLTVRAAEEPVVGLLIDRFTDGALSTSANEPFLRGGRSATVRLP